MAKEVLKAKWDALLQPLVGRRIVKIGYMRDGDVKAVGWDRSAVMLVLDDGTLLYPSSDDEGNDAGALFIQPSDTLKASGVPDAAPVI